MSYYTYPSNFEKITAGLLYSAAILHLPLITWAPLIWLMVLYFRKEPVKDFVRYHCYQALLFNMIVSFLPQLVALLVNIIINILGMISIFANTVKMLQGGVALVFQAFGLLVMIVSVYAMIQTFRGKYTEIPPLSQAVNLLLR